MDKPDTFMGVVIEENSPSSLASWCESKASEFGIPVLRTMPDQGLFLHLTSSGIGLRDASLPKQTPVVAEFTSAEMMYRLKASSPKSELIMRAIGNKQAPWTVVDATPGLGRDAMVMANFGCRVTMFERSPVVALLLADGLRQLNALNVDLHQRLALYLGDSIETLNVTRLMEKDIEQPDVVYLDPMFPHRKKSALVKKEMQLFQRLLGHDSDADNLFTSALKVAKKRVVVKRPNYAEPLNKQDPNLTITSKKHRFDVYLTH